MWIGHSDLSREVCRIYLRGEYFRSCGELKRGEGESEKKGIREISKDVEQMQALTRWILTVGGVIVLVLVGLTFLLIVWLIILLGYIDFMILEGLLGRVTT